MSLLDALLLEEPVPRAPTPRSIFSFRRHAACDRLLHENNIVAIGNHDRTQLVLPTFTQGRSIDCEGDRFPSFRMLRQMKSEMKRESEFV